MIRPFRLCKHCLRAEPEAGICPKCGFDGEPQNPPHLLPEGTPVGGHYVLGRKEGQGGFSICYRAWDGAGEEMVAVKELFPAEVAGRLTDGTVRVDQQHEVDFSAAAHSLEHEAEVLRKLDKQPNIVQVREVFHDNNTVYLAMEYLRGRSYDAYLQDQYNKTGRFLDSETAVNVARTMLGALEAVHANGLRHLDLKPANVRVLDDARIVLLDFGSARDAFRVGDGPYGDTFTPGFAAPEQHSVDRPVSPSTDVYGVAAVLYYSLSLQVPKRADEREDGAALPSLCALNPAVPGPLDLVIRKAMSLDPAQRYASVDAFKAALDPFGTGRRPLSLPMGDRSSVPLSVRLFTGLFDVAVTLALLAMAAASVDMDETLLAPDGVLLWLATQLLPRAIGATPGMLTMRLRLMSMSGKPITLVTVLLRTMVLPVTLLGFRFRPDRNGLLLHDRISDSRIVDYSPEI